MHQGAGNQGPIARNVRVARAVGKVGMHVMRGVVSTFFGLLFISAASSNIFRTMFKLFLLIILLSTARKTPTLVCVVHTH